MGELLGAWIGGLLALALLCYLARLMMAVVWSGLIELVD